MELREPQIGAPKVGFWERGERTPDGMEIHSGPKGKDVLKNQEVGPAEQFNKTGSL